jgi:phosphate acyltransferase
MGAMKRSDSAQKKTVRLAVDVGSGDYGPSVIIAGVLIAQRETDIPFEAYLCGDRHEIEGVLIGSGNSGHAGFIIEHCPDRISLNDKLSSVWKTRAHSSIVRSITLQKEGRVQTSVSAGDTAILMGAALFILGRNEGISRPALAAFLPTTRKHPVLLLDVGANCNCRTDHLVSFGMMGSSYFSRIFNERSPSVALLNIGKEPRKGTRIIGDAGRILEKQLSNYAGFVEGNGILTGEVDVVVCDGFAGNVLLKACESFHALVASILKNQPDLLERVQGNMDIINPENYGAVPLLGIKGNVLKAHGGSSPRAIANAVIMAITAAQRAW